MCTSIPDKGKRFLSVTKHPDQPRSPLVFHRLAGVLFWQQSGWSLMVTNHLHLLPPLRILSSVTHHGVYRGSLSLLFLLYSVWGLRAVVFRGWSFVKVKYGLRCFGVWQSNRESGLSSDYVSRAVSSFLFHTLHSGIKKKEVTKMSQICVLSLAINYNYRLSRRAKYIVFCTISMKFLFQ